MPTETGHDSPAVSRAKLQPSGAPAFHCSLQWARSPAKGTNSRPNRLAPLWFTAGPVGHFPLPRPIVNLQRS
jgi:hypothetical protein